MSDPDLDFYVDSHWGIPSARSSDELRLLAQFLESDLQSRIDWIDDVVAAVDQIGSAERTEYSRDGNSLMLTASTAGALLAEHYGSDELELSLADLRSAVVGWGAFVRRVWTERPPNQ